MLQPSCSAYLDGAPICATIRDGEGALAAAVCLKPGRLGLRAAANVESGDWDAVARDNEARELVWREVARLSAPSILLQGLRQDSDSLRCGVARERYRASRAGSRARS